MKFKKSSFAAASIMAISVAAFSQEVYAQDDGEAAGERDSIIVTGSRIQRQDYVSPSPLVTTDVETYTISGRSTVDDFLRDLPQFGPGTGDFSNDSNGGTAGRATLNLRNLGAKRNLVIMDGRRLISSGTDGAIDINIIPSLAIGNIEVITGGASATYGSDALSGVVNFKTRTDLDGFELDVQASTLDGDTGANSYRVGGAFGTEYANGAGSLLISAEYSDRGGVRYFERDFFNVNPQASSFTVYGRSRVGRDWLSVNNDGTVFNTARAVPFGVNGTLFNGDVELPLLIDENGGIRTHGQFRNWIQVPLEQVNAFAKTEYDLSNNITVYGQALYASSTASNVGAEPISAGVWAVTIPQDNYYLQQVPELAALTDPNGVSTFQTRILQAGNRFYDTENDVLQILGGLRGEFANRDLNWDLHVSYGRTDTTDRTISGAVNFVALQELIDTTDPATGITPLCQGGYNPFGGTDPLSPACLDYISRTPVNETTLEQFVVEGVLEGKLLDLPAGESRFAASVNYRENSYEFTPDPDVAAAELANLASAQFTEGNISVFEIAGEVLLPVLSDAAFMQSMNLNLGGRFSEYDPAGSTWTYKAEVDARINDNLMLRGGYQRAVRAPNVEEFFRASLLRVQPFDDVCSAGYRGPRNDPAAEAALCALQGADPAYRQAGSSAPTITDGNPNLVPEVADTFTFGAVLDFDLGGAGFQMTADYYNIEVDEAIEVLSAADVFVKCFNIDGTSNPTYDINYIACQQISRPTPFDLDPVNQPILNLGGIKTAGVDVATTVDIPVDALAWGNEEGGLTFRSLINILDKHEIQAFTDEVFVDFAGTVSTITAFPDLKMLNSVIVDSGPVSFIGTWRHISSMDDRSTASNPTSTVEGAPAYNYFDITARARVGESAELYVGVNNVGNKLPPQIGGSTDDGVFSATNQGVYDGIGRMFFLGARARF